MRARRPLDGPWIARRGRHHRRLRGGQIHAQSVLVTISIAGTSVSVADVDHPRKRLGPVCVSCSPACFLGSALRRSRSRSRRSPWGIPACVLLSSAHSSRGPRPCVWSLAGNPRPPRTSLPTALLPAPPRPAPGQGRRPRASPTRENASMRSAVARHPQWTVERRSETRRAEHCSIANRLWANWGTKRN